MTAPAPLRLTPKQAQAARDAAWDRYATIPHADPRVGRARYRAEIAAIEAMEVRS